MQGSIRVCSVVAMSPLLVKSTTATSTMWASTTCRDVVSKSRQVNRGVDVGGVGEAVDLVEKCIHKVVKAARSDSCVYLYAHHSLGQPRFNSPTQNTKAGSFHFYIRPPESHLFNHIDTTRIFVIHTNE